MNNKYFLSFFALAIFLSIHCKAQTPHYADICRTRTFKVVLALEAHFNKQCALISYEDLETLKVLDFEGYQLTEIKADDLYAINNLEALYLNENYLKTLPLGLFDKLSKLKILNIANNELKSLPVGIFSKLSSIETINLSGNMLTELPELLFADLSNLTSLSLAYNKIQKISDTSFKGLKNLVELYLDMNKLESLQGNLFLDLSSLKYLGFRANWLATLDPDTFTGLTKLIELNLMYSKFEKLPESFYKLSTLEKVYLYRNNLAQDEFTKISKELPQLIVDIK